MALDDMAAKLVQETQTTLLSTKFVRDCEIKITPRRMRALILAQQQRMSMQLNGVTIVLVEDAAAPESFADAVFEAIAPEDTAPPEPTAEELAQWRAFKKAQAEL